MQFDIKVVQSNIQVNDKIYTKVLAFRESNAGINEPCVKVIYVPLLLIPTSFICILNYLPDVKRRYIKLRNMTFLMTNVSLHLLYLKVSTALAYANTQTRLTAVCYQLALDVFPCQQTFTKHRLLCFTFICTIFLDCIVQA